MKKILLSGVKPTGAVHIGNYFGAMRQFVDLQNEYQPFVFIANYHALTSVSDGVELRKLSLDVAMDYLAIGLDPKKTTMFLQSDVPAVTELAWIFNTITTVPYLMRAHAFKDQVGKNYIKGKTVNEIFSDKPESLRTWDEYNEERYSGINIGLFDYPILMAADILIYGADIVPVGFDQKQHIEIARDTAQKYNRTFGEAFKVPEPLILENLKTIIGTDGRKMSKSYGNTIGLFAEDDEIKKAVMSIPTDSKGISDKKDPEEDKVFAFHKLFSADDELSDLRTRYLNGGIGYKESKEILIKNICAFITPLREKRKEIAHKPDEVIEMLRAGGVIAREIAEEKMKQVRKQVGIQI